MHDDFIALYSFNRWANDKMLGACRELSAEQFVAEPAPGWTSVRATVWHIVVVTEGWLKALTDDPDQGFPAETDITSVDDAAEVLRRAHAIFDSLRDKLTHDYLESPKTISRRGRTAVLPPWIILRHIVNHTTYHRGQVASKLKRFGIQQAETDLVYWAFEQIPQGK